jgi:amino acid permease
MLSISISLNALSTHGACTAIFVAVAFVIAFGCSSIQTLGKISSLAWVGITCIIVAIFTVTIAVGIQDHPYAAPQGGVWVSDYKIVNSPDFASASAALSSLVFAYAGTPAFFSIVSEMRDPKHYTRSLMICQVGMTMIYLIIGIVVYFYCGSYVASPALGSAGPTVKKAAYGVALPGLIVSTTLLTHYPAKYIFVRALRKTRHLAANTKIHWMSWLGCTFAVALIAYIIASAIPVFGGLISLIGALFGTLMSFQPMACMWLYDYWKEGAYKGSRSRWMLMVGWCVFVIVIGSFLMIAGTYGSVVGIIDSYKTSGGSAAWTCADNSNSVGRATSSGGGH